MKRNHTLYIIATLILVFTGCKKNEYPSDPVVDLVDFSYHFGEYPNAYRDSVLEADRQEIDALLDVVSDTTLAQWSNSRAVRIFSPDVQKVYPTLENLEKNIGYSLSRAEALGLDFPKREYAAVVYGRPEAILFVDSVMLIALNHFLGPDYPGYAGMPEYLRLRKTPQQLPYAVAEALVGIQYPFGEVLNTTLLSRMLYEGALVRAKMQLVDQAKPWFALGYDKATYDQLIKEESKIWESLVQTGMVFDTSEATIDRVCGVAPFVRIGADEWPARVGRFIGWRIVESFVKKHPEQAALPYLLSSEFYLSDKVLAQSGY